MKKLILIILSLFNYSFVNAQIIQPVMIIPGWLQADSIYARAVLIDTIKTEYTTFKDSSITIEDNDKAFITTDSLNIDDNFIVDKDGNVGIGTSSTNSAPLYVVSSTTEGIIIAHSNYLANYGRWYMEADGDMVLSNDEGSRSISLISGRNIQLNAATSRDIVLNANQLDVNTYLQWDSGTALFTEGSSGNVGIGTNFPGTKLETADNTANAAHSLATFLNDDEQATGETGQTTDILFEMKGTIDGGSNYTNQESGKISNYKISDYFHAADETDNDAGLKISTVTNGAYELNTTFSSDDVEIAGNLTVNGLIDGGGDYGEMGNAYGSDATEALAVAGQWYAMYHANINAGLLEGWTYTDGHAGAISATSTGAGATVTMTSAGHTLVADDWVTINGTTTYNGVEQIVSISGNDFVITATNSEADEGGGNAAFQEGSYLECNTAGKYRGVWTCSFKQSAANAQAIIISPFVDGTQSTKAVGVEYLANVNDVATPAGNGMMDFTVGQRIWFGVQSTVAQTITSKVRNVTIE